MSERYQAAELAHSFRKIREEFDFDLNDRPPDVSVQDWPLRVSVYRRQLYAIAEAKVVDVLSTTEKREIWARYSTGSRVLKTSGTPPEQTSDALAETAAMAVLFNDQRYLDFLHGTVCNLSGLPAAVRQQLEKRVGVEVVYRALKWNDQPAKGLLSRLRRDGLRAPTLFLDFPAGTEVNDKWYWDQGVATAVVEERWRTADNPHAYLRTAARRIICARIVDDESERIKAAREGVPLRCPDWPNGKPKEYGLDPENTSLSFDREKAFDMAGFDADMVNYVDAKVAGVSRSAMPAYLTERTGSPWDSRRVENARGRVRTHARKFLDVVNEIGEFGVSQGTGSEAGEVAVGRKYGPSVIQRQDGEPAKASPARKCHSSRIISWGSQSHYKQRLYPSLHWAFAHLFDGGNGVMDDGTETLREILAAERKALMAEFRPDAEQQRSEATISVSRAPIMVARRLVPMCDISRPTGFGRVFRDY